MWKIKTGTITQKRPENIATKKEKEDAPPKKPKKKKKKVPKTDKEAEFKSEAEDEETKVNDPVYDPALS